MDLWIRSQDKEDLTKVRRGIYLEPQNSLDLSYGETIETGEYFIMVDGYSYGEYKTKERALEVLDEIQNLLYTRVMCKADITDDEANLLFCKESQGKLIPDTMLYAKPINLNSIVYQMPEK